VREVMAHGGIAILAVVFALALALFGTATAIAQLGVFVLNQHAGRDDFGPLDFEVFGTRLQLDGVVTSLFALLLVTAALLAVWWLAQGAVRSCPECRSDVPLEATICRHCTTELESRA
jgi:hypothetical protein